MSSRGRQLHCTAHDFLFFYGHPLLMNRKTKQKWKITRSVHHEGIVLGGATSVEIAAEADFDVDVNDDLRRSHKTLFTPVNPERYIPAFATFVLAHQLCRVMFWNFSEVRMIPNSSISIHILSILDRLKESVNFVL